jgi:hypothetical protein
MGIDDGARRVDVFVSKLDEVPVGGCVPSGWALVTGSQPTMRSTARLEIHTT